MDNFNLHGFFKKQYLTEGDITTRPYDLQDHPDIKIFADTLSKMLNVNVEQRLGSGRYNGREGYYIKMPRQIMYWDRDQDKIKVEAIFDKINKLTKEYEFELNDLTDYDEEPGERSWPANVGFFVKEKSINEMDMNDPVLMKMRAAMSADKKAEKDIDNIKRMAPKSDRKSLTTLKKLGVLNKERERLMRDMEQEAEPEGGPIADEYGAKLNRIDAAIAKLSGRKEMTYDQAIVAESKGAKNYFDDLKFYYQKAFRYLDSSEKKEYQRLAKNYFSKLNEDDQAIAENETYASSFGGFRKELDGETIENELQAKGYETPPTGIWNKILVNKNDERVAMIDTDESSYTKDGKSYQWSGTERFIDHVESLNESALGFLEEATKEEETEFHTKLDKLVHNTFGKRKGELEESSSSEEKRIAMRAIKSIAKYRGVSEDEARRDLMRAAEELGSLKEAIEDIKETIELGKNLTEELCAKGKAYRKKRMAAGEKSSAYLNGRAVKVCKGQIKG